MPLTLQPNFHHDGEPPLREFTPGDDFYEMLVNAHADLTDEQSALLNAKLVLLMANHIGELAVLREAIDLARKGMGEPD